MIEWLMQRGFGGCEGTRLHLGERLTLCTGESETGKSRLLDCLWHAAAGTWPGEVNEQISGSTGSGLGAPNAVIATVLSGCNGAERRPVQTDGRQRTANDTTETDRPDTVYAHANGAMSIVGPDGALSLSPREVWTGNSEPFETRPLGTSVREPLRWEGTTSRLRSAFRRGSKAAENLAEILDELLSPGTRNHSAGSDAISRVLNEPATVQARGGGAARWIALGAVLDWLREARSKAGHRRDLLVMIDDIERGLHPRRQRTVLYALTRAVETTRISGRAQTVCTTTSPLVLGSATPWFERETDRLILLQHEEGTNQPTAEELDYCSAKTYAGWLTSRAIGLGSARTDPMADEAIKRATRALTRPERTSSEMRAARVALVGALPPGDEFIAAWDAEAAGDDAAAKNRATETEGNGYEEQWCYAVSDPSAADLRPTTAIAHPGRVYATAAQAETAATKTRRTVPDKVLSTRTIAGTPSWATERMTSDGSVTPIAKTRNRERGA